MSIRKGGFAVSTAMALSMFVCAEAATTDSEGMPIVYLRGDFTSPTWEPDQAYRFTRSGNTYRLEITADNPVFEGKFKIGDDDWDFDFGGVNDDVRVDRSCSLTLKGKGANIRTAGILRGEISFEYTTGDNLEVNFTVNELAGNLGNSVTGTLPVMYINVYKDESKDRFDNEVISYDLDHKNYFGYSEYWLDVNGCQPMIDAGAESLGSEEEPLPLQIKARGNWTRRGFSKKPFKIKLDKKQNLLGLTPEKSKHYALLAHPDDTYGFLRNFTAFDLGERIGLPWTPGMQPVELVINGNYRGLYFLTESIRVGDGRIDIEELDDNADDPELVSGGYVVELDNYDEDNQISMDEMSWVDNQHLDRLRITWDTPEVYSPIQERFITEQFTAINNLIGRNDNAMWSYLDLDDAARYYLVWEIVGHTEAYHGSTYLFRDRGENQKWHFSPLWDAGNAFRAWNETFFYDCDPFGNTWIPSLRENRMFNDKVKETWLWFMHNEYPGIEDDIDAYVSLIKTAARADHARWANEPVPNDGQTVADNSNIGNKASEVKNYLAERVRWLKRVFGDYTSGSYAEPERDLTAAAELPDYIKAGIEDIFDDDNNSPLEYFNLQGMKVSNPQSGNIYIVKKGKESRKVMMP